APLPETELALSHSFLQHQEQNSRYRGDAPGADSLDRWYYTQRVLSASFIGGGPADYALPVYGHQGAGSLSISLWGYLDTEHEAEVWVNGAYKDSFTWSGIAYNELSLEAVDVKDSVVNQNAQLATAGSISLAAEALAVDDYYNEMLIEITAGKGAGQVRKISDYDSSTNTATVDDDFSPLLDATSVYRIDSSVTLVCNSIDDIFYVDFFELSYARSFLAVNNELQFVHENGDRYVIDDFSTNDLLIFDISNPSDVARIENAQIDSTGPFSFSVGFEPPINPGTTETYLVISAANYKTPVSISEDQGSDLADSDNQADYILITHTDIGWESGGDAQPWLTALVELREEGGFEVKVVNVADIFDEFSYGLQSPVAIRDFLAYAYSNWQTPAPRYVLLVGDASYDYKDNLNIGTINYVPSYALYTNWGTEALTDEYLVKVSGADAIPDMYIGRLPAASEAQAQLMVEKIIYYEQQQLAKDWRQKVLLVADNQTEAYEAVFETINEDAIALLPSKMVPLRGYLGSSTALAIANFIDTNIGSGALIVNYSGHGGYDSWATETLFENADVAALDNEGKYPFVISMSCLTGNFGTVWPTGEAPSLAETLLRADSEGAVAALMPTGLSTTGGQHILNTALFEALFVDDIRELGPAILSAKQTLLANVTSDYEQISATFLLFGDPATALRIPLPRMPKNVTAQRLANGQVRIRWQAALDSNGNAVAGYNIYRASAPAGPYSKINTELITATEFIDISGGVTINAGGGGGGSYYYGVSSEDGDGDESAQSLGISPASVASAAAGPVLGCFIESVGGSIPAALCWVLVVFTAVVVLTHWLRAQKSGLRTRLRHAKSMTTPRQAEVKRAALEPCAVCLAPRTIYEIVLLN
ncbi:MAG: C25 family cysteine peptidase, partial [Desulfobacterales bacterium]